MRSSRRDKPCQTACKICRINKNKPILGLLFGKDRFWWMISCGFNDSHESENYKVKHPPKMDLRKLEVGRGNNFKHAQVFIPEKSEHDFFGPSKIRCLTFQNQIFASSCPQDS